MGALSRRSVRRTVRWPGKIHERPARPDPRGFGGMPARVEFDRTRRTIMVPDLWRIDGLIDVHVGRHGPEQPEQLGDRVLATIWTDRTAMNAGMGL